MADHTIFSLKTSDLVDIFRLEFKKAIQDLDIEDRTIIEAYSNDNHTKKGNKKKHLI